MPGKASIVSLCCLAAGLTVIFAQDTATPQFDRTDAMIPARDGVRLHTVIFKPRKAPEPFPILLERTPYGATRDEAALLRRYSHLVADGYIFAFQDIRGRFQSEGEFVMQRPPRPKGDPKAIDEGTDTYDTIDWLLRNVSGNNGRVGMVGISYGGWLTTMALLEPHPALKAASEQASPADMFLGDDFHHNGAFRLSYGFEYAALLETDKESWDQEDFYGPLKIYDLFEKSDARNNNFLAVGPWNHGGWARTDCGKLGVIPFDGNPCEYFRVEIEAPWFAYWLKDKGDGKFAEARVFQTGSNRWQEYDFWPPRTAQPRPLYFRAQGKLSFEPPGDATAGFDSYTSDPAHPVPYRHRPISPTYPGGGWPTWLVEDQRFVDNRPDVLTWQTQTLDQDLNIAGDIVTQLYASTTGTDSDWIVKLIDVYPESDPGHPELEGYELIVADEILRGRFRESFENPKPIVPGAVTPYRIDLHTNDHAFRKGHRIMVQVQSTWFPLYDRNPQTFVPNLFLAKASDYHAAVQRVFRTKAQPSAVVLPVVK